jgi:ADP-ribose pyrophosphatase YjhB (NUDIX family)
VSAGGLVTRTIDGVPHCALIGRRDQEGVLRWLLPKGHVEPGETLRAAAVREIREETGIVGEVLAELGTVAFWFTASDRRVHKTVHHYVLRAVGGELSDNDVEVDAVAWVPLDQVPRQLSYADERRLAQLVPAILADHT